MKYLHHFFTLLIAIVAFTCFFSGIYLSKQNKILKQSTANFPELFREQQRLSEENTILKKKWECNADISDTLSKDLILPQKETSEKSINIYDPESQSHIPIHESYLSGFIAYDNCINVLEKLCDAQLPILITSLSIHRNIAHNYALQISVTYRTK